MNTFRGQRVEDVAFERVKMLLYNVCMNIPVPDRSDQLDDCAMLEFLLFQIEHDMGLTAQSWSHLEELIRKYSPNVHRNDREQVEQLWRQLRTNFTLPGQNLSFLSDTLVRACREGGSLSMTSDESSDIPVPSDICEELHNLLDQAWEGNWPERRRLQELVYAMLPREPDEAEKTRLFQSFHKLQKGGIPRSEFEHFKLSLLDHCRRHPHIGVKPSPGWSSSRPCDKIMDAFQDVILEPRNTQKKTNLAARVEALQRQTEDQREQYELKTMARELLNPRFIPSGPQDSILPRLKQLIMKICAVREPAPSVQEAQSQEYCDSMNYFLDRVFSGAGATPHDRAELNKIFNVLIQKVDGERRSYLEGLFQKLTQGGGTDKREQTTLKLILNKLCKELTSPGWATRPTEPPKPPPSGWTTVNLCKRLAQLMDEKFRLRGNFTKTEELLKWMRFVMARVRGDKYLLREWWNRFMGDYIPQEEYRIFKRDMLLACRNQSSPLWFSRPEPSEDPEGTETTDPSVQGPGTLSSDPSLAEFAEAPTREQQCDQMMFLLRELKRQGGRMGMANNKRELLSRLWHTFVQTLSGDNSVLESMYRRLNEGTITKEEFNILMRNIQQICDGHNQEWFGRPTGDAAMPGLRPDFPEQQAQLGGAPALQQFPIQQAQQGGAPALMPPPGPQQEPEGSLVGYPLPPAAPSPTEECDRLLFLLRALKEQGTLSDAQNYEISRLWHQIVETLPGDISILQAWYQRLRARTIPENEFRLLIGQIQSLCDQFTGGGWYSRPLGDAAMPPLEQAPLDQLASLIQAGSRGGQDRFAVQNIFSIFNDFRPFMQAGDVAQLAMYRNLHQQGIQLPPGVWQYFDQLLERIKQAQAAQAQQQLPQQGDYNPFKSPTPTVESHVLDPFQRPDIAVADVIQPVQAQMGGAPALQQFADVQATVPLDHRLPAPPLPAQAGGQQAGGQQAGGQQMSPAAPQAGGREVVPFSPAGPVAPVTQQQQQQQQQPNVAPVRATIPLDRRIAAPPPRVGPGAVVPFAGAELQAGQPQPQGAPMAPVAPVLATIPPERRLPAPQRQAGQGQVVPVRAPGPLVEAGQPKPGIAPVQAVISPERRLEAPPPRQEQPLIEEGDADSVSTFDSGEFEAYDPPGQAVFQGRAVQAFRPELFSPPETHVSAALHPSPDEVENFLQEPNDMFNRLPVEGFIRERRNEGATDEEIVQQLSQIKPQFTAQALTENFPKEEQAPVLMLEAPQAQYRALPDLDAKKGRHDVLSARLESLYARKRRYPGDSDNLLEIQDVRREMRQLSEEYDFDPPLTVVSSHEDVEQRKADVEALQVKLDSQLKNVDRNLERNSTAIKRQETELSDANALYEQKLLQTQKLTSDLQAKTDRYRQKETLFLKQGGKKLQGDMLTLARQKQEIREQRRAANLAMQSERQRKNAIEGRLNERRRQQEKYARTIEQLQEKQKTAAHDLKMLGQGKRLRDDLGAPKEGDDRARKRRGVSKVALELDEIRRESLLDEGTQRSKERRRKRRPKAKAATEEDEKYNPPAAPVEERAVALLPEHKAEYRDYVPVTELDPINPEDIEITKDDANKALKLGREHYETQIMDYKSDLKRASSKYTKAVADMEKLTNKDLGKFTRGEVEKLANMQTRTVQDKSLSKDDGDTLIVIVKKYMKKAGLRVLHMESKTRLLDPRKLAEFKKITGEAHDGKFKVTPIFVNGMLNVLGGRSTTYKAKFERIAGKIEKSKKAVQEEKRKIAFNSKLLGQWNEFAPLKRKKKKTGVQEGKKLLLLKARREASPDPPAVPDAPDERPRQRRRVKSPGNVPEFSEVHGNLE